MSHYPFLCRRYSRADNGNLSRGSRQKVIQPRSPLRSPTAFGTFTLVLVGLDQKAGVHLLSENVRRTTPFTGILDTFPLDQLGKKYPDNWWDRGGTAQRLRDGRQVREFSTTNINFDCSPIVESAPTFP